MCPPTYLKRSGDQFRYGPNMNVEQAHPPATVNYEQQYHHLITSRQFTLQLEFLSSLSSPAYLNSLTLVAPGSSQSIPPISQPSFLRYLQHIYSIWSRPEYAKYVQFPNSLVFCRLLIESSDFRTFITNNEWVNDTSEELISHWTNWRRRHQS
ncbi:unnamed protein product [Sympodiomycopsis kandeliae]